MRKEGDKISIRMDADGHYIFYSFRDEGAHGTILDFVMRRQGKNCGEARGSRDAVAAEYMAK